MYTKEEGYKKLVELVTRFGEQIESYKKSDYNETQTRRDFIDPFFIALGWDVQNEQGFAEAYREVIHEDKIKIAGATKAPDYSFRLPGGKKLFFVEAKKPSIVVKDDIQPAYQVRRYGWSAKLPISVITDFEEFAIYDCTKKPKPNDSASVSRIKYLTFNEYLNEFEFLWGTFSKEQVLKGSFDKFVINDNNKKGTTTVDKEFLNSLDSWRTLLAQNISRLNKDLDEYQLNFSVQQIIDRIIFLRIAEDRGIELYGNLKFALKGENFYFNLIKNFNEADQKYNSGLFDLNKDTLTPSLKIDNRIIKQIIEELYYPLSPYEFSVLSVEILGSAYEKFLGKIIRITPSHLAKIDEKPEVRKAGGVYYTPQYIVDFIIKNTLGKLIISKTPREVASVKILDPACGSGSFLLGTYQYLLDWHKSYYINSITDGINNIPLPGKKDSPLTPEGNLTTNEKKRILLNNIFGIDIDSNAVEVTKLSLLLKCMEGETEASINQQLSLFNERILPTLDKNIVSGNSLIDTDFYDGDLGIESGIERKIKPFSFHYAFKDIFEAGGFEVVVGNPPFVKIQTLQESQPFEVINYFKRKYFAATSGNYDLYVLFLEKGYNLLKRGGKLGFILPHKFFQAEFGAGVRNFIAQRKAVSEIVNFGSEQIFEGATTYTCLLFAGKKENETISVTNVTSPLSWANDKESFKSFSVNHPSVNQRWNFTNPSNADLIHKLNCKGERLGEITRKIFVGLQTSADKIYIMDKLADGENTISLFSKQLERIVEIEKGLLKPILMGKDVKKYIQPKSEKMVIFPYKIIDGKAILLSQTEIKKTYPLGWEFLLHSKKNLETRENGKFRETWWQYGRTQNLIEFETKKIMTPDIANTCQFTIDTDGTFYHSTTVFSLSFNEKKISNDLYFLALFNSKIMNFHIRNFSTILRGGYFRFHKQYIENFNVIQHDQDDSDSRKLHDEIVEYSRELLNLNTKVNQGKIFEELDVWKQKINFLEDKINHRFYQIYGLNDREIKTLEDKLVE